MQSSDAGHDIVVIGWIGLLLPFILVLIAAFAFGAHSATQLAISGLLLVFAVAIQLLRWRARHQ